VPEPGSAQGEPEPEPAPEPVPEPAPEPVPEPTPEPTPREDVGARLDALEAEAAELREQNNALKEQVERLEDDQAYTESRIQRILPFTGRVGGYVDVGFFFVSGDGTGIRPDSNREFFPDAEFDDIPSEWVFMGDPLSTMINSRGDPAETGDSRAVLLDTVDNGGKASFIVNNFNLNLYAGLGERVAVEGLIDFLPRTRDPSDPDGAGFGDYVDVKMAYLRYDVPARRFDLAISAGKFNPVVGYEYRIQESPARVSVTPSLICRYNCGRPIGVKLRWRFLPDRNLVFNMAVTNGSSFVEQFGFANEIDTNFFKTVSGRLSYEIPGTGLELGASGAGGAQDLQTEDTVLQWQVGGDLHLDIKGVDIAGEFTLVRAQGDDPNPGVVAADPPCAQAPCLEAMGAYGIVGYRALNWLMPYVRADWRDALHREGASFVYISELVRFTGGVRFDVNEYVIVKAEYTHNLELGNIDPANNDVFTTSVVAHY